MKRQTQSKDSTQFHSQLPHRWWYNVMAL